MTSKKELRQALEDEREFSQSLLKKIDDHIAAFNRLQVETAAFEKDRDKYLRQIQSARSATEDLRRALYPDTYGHAFTPNTLPALPFPYTPALGGSPKW